MVASASPSTVRTCDRDGCDEPGDRPAPKSPNSPERWWFCQAHAAEYNRGWDYFEGLSAEEAAAREAEERRGANGYSAASHYAGAGRATAGAAATRCARSTCSSSSSDADFDAIKAAWRKLAKANHPDASPDDPDAAKRFHAVQTAWEVLRAAEERRVP